MPVEPTCVSCEEFLRPRKNEVYVLETMDDDRPYRIWCADLWECPGCGVQIIKGYGQQPIAEHYQEDFNTWVQRLVTHRVDGKLKGLPGD
jgi:predicted RNA-binding Zn-ribbon protein involved in translation (DUF1610 family)